MARGEDTRFHEARQVAREKFRQKLQGYSADEEPEQYDRWQEDRERHADDR